MLGRSLSTQGSAKRRSPRKKRLASDITSNMVGPGAMSSKSTKKTSIFSSREPEAEPSPGLKEVFGKPEGVYLHTRTRKGGFNPS